MKREMTEVNGIKPGALYTHEPIPESFYLKRYAEDSEIMTYYENLIKQVNPLLSLSTGLKELPVIFSKFDLWDSIIKERLSVAPNKEIAIELFKKELLDYVDYKSNESNLTEIEKIDNYWKRFRKIAYDYYLKGQNVTMQRLGYLILNHQYENINSEKNFIKISNLYDAKGVLESLAEGAGFAEYLHSKKYLQLVATNQPTVKTFDSTLAPEPTIDPLSFLNKDYYHLNKFYEVEKRALNGATTFNSEIRCAAFCEKLYIEKFITNTKTKNKTLTSFAKARYGKDISKALAGSKKKVREEYLSRPKGGSPPLKNAFL